MDDRRVEATDPDLPRALGERIRDLGVEIGLPFIAAAGDISSPEPLLDAQGRPYAETLFQWVDPTLEYWKDRGFALRSPFVNAVRYTSEPLYFHAGRFASWRPKPQLDAIEVAAAAEAFGIRSAVIAPVYLPRSVIGAIVWASPEVRPNLPALFAARADELHAAAIRFLAAYHDQVGSGATPVKLTRREVQCLKWAAAGKTDQEVAHIIHISMPTVRFHIRNASEKLRVVGRAQAVHRAATLGYIGAIPAAAAHA
jgi:DNA-binding CsgD family transcriptional regulator